MPEITRIAEKKLSASTRSEVREGDPVRSRLRPLRSANFMDLCTRSDLPRERDILQFWIRTEPLFRLMLEKDQGGPKA